jgi:hypothetical protein
MAYTLPQVLVFQEFVQSPLAIANPLRAVLIGPNAKLFRYADADEKQLIRLGSYDPEADTDYDYPGRPTGGLVDQGYFKLYAEDVLLQYFRDAVGAGGTQVPVSGYSNRLRSSNRNYKENIVGDTTYARDALFLDRDVQIGDIVDVAGTVDGDAYTLRTAVKAIVGDEVAATTDAADPDDDNQDTVAADSATVAQTEGPYNCLSAGADSSAYNGLVDGDVVETYTVEVTRSSAGGDLTTARLRVRSASGNDDANDVTPAALGSPTDIGTRGLTMTWDLDGGGACVSSASIQDADSDDLVVGQTWVVEVEQAFTAPTATSGGTYTGDFDAKYIVEISRGGNTADDAPPQIRVTTDIGVDVSGPTSVTGADVAVNVGTKGVTISFDQQNLRKGDIYYIDVTAAFEGDMKTLVLANNMPDDFLASSDLDVTLYIKKASLLIPENRENSAPDVNYELGDAGDTDTGFTVKAGITVTDSSWTDDGEEQPLDVAEATLFAEYRAWVCDVGDSIYGIGDIGDIDDVPGATHPDNPLKFAISKALANNNGVQVLYIAVCDPDDTASWEDAIEKLVGYRGLHGIVPLTFDKSIVDLFAAHAQSQSSAEQGRWRVVWTTLQATESEAIVNAASSTDEEVVLATTSDDPDVSGSQYRILQVPAGNAQFLVNGVRAGDTVRYLYSSDGWGDESYDEFVVDAVINEDELRLKTGTDTAITTPRKVEVWRNYRASELAEQLADKAGAFGSFRVRAIWPDEVGNDGEVFAGYFLTAALAALRSGVLPQQGLTNMAISGFDDVTRTTKLFNRTQLDTMANAGVWIVTKNEDGNVVTRHALTTAGYGDVATQEEMVIANADSRSQVYLSGLEDMIGITNVTPGTLDVVHLRVQAMIDQFKEVQVERIGGQLIDGEVLAVRQHATLHDRIVVEVLETAPAPLNVIELHQQVVV